MTRTENIDTEVVCAVCGHDLDSHDAIARRFCTATAAGEFHRGCVCVSPAKPAAEPSTVD